LETSDFQYVFQQEKDKAERLHRLKMQTEGHTQSGLVHDSGHHMMFKRLSTLQAG